MGSNTSNISDFQAWQELAQNEGKECVVGAVIINDQGRAFVQKRSRDRRLFPGCWDIVGGHIDPGETLYEGLRREIAEETGWKLTRIITILGQFDWVTDQKARRELDLLVEVEGNLDAPQIEWSKHSEFRWINLNEIEILKENRASSDNLIYEVVKKGLEFS